MKAFAPLVLLTMMASAPALAQEPILKEGQVTENALIDALTPAVPEAAPEVAPSGRTRSIRVRRDEPPAAAALPATPPKRASASLLITFETNSAQLTAQAKRSLDTVAQALASDKLGKFRFGIEGYADPRGGSEANLKLSQARAEAVRGYLIGSKGIDSARLEAVGKGATELLNKENPIAAENRRVTIVNLSKM